MDNKLGKRANSAEIYNQAIGRLRTQVWTGLMLISLGVLITFRYLRFRDGFTDPTPLGLALMLVFGGVLVAGLLLRNTRYVTWLQTVFVVAMHVNVPVSLLYFGGAQGPGDINLFVTIMISALYGWHRWMWPSFGVSVATLIYVIYLDLIGRPLNPLVENTAQLASLKLAFFLIIVLFTFYLALQFYRRLLDSYRDFSAEQIEINRELQANEAQLTAGTHDLRVSRQRIVTARAEERRRLRRDLHDGLGPTLAAQVFRVGAARNLYQAQPAKADHFLAEIESTLSGTIADVQRLVDSLRPPQLDQLGLLGAIRDHVQRFAVPFTIELDLQPLPPDTNAATEVAIWRIVQTALDNVAKHANAQRCWLTLSCDAAEICLTIADDGGGLGADVNAGVGLTSMRERSEELGGTLTVEPNEPHGTCIVAHIPLAVEVGA